MPGENRDYSLLLQLRVLRFRLFQDGDPGCPSSARWKSSEASQGKCGQSSVHFFSSADQFVTSVIEADFVRSALSDALSRARLSTITVRIWLLGKKSQQAGRHERSPPDQVEVEPSVTEKREAELTIECPGDQSRDRKITDRVDSCSENPC